MNRERGHKIGEEENQIFISSEELVKSLKDFCWYRGWNEGFAISRLLEFWYKNHTICQTCEGRVVNGTCINCGRSDDFEHEELVKIEKRKRHRNWHTYQTIQVRRDEDKLTY